MRILALGGCGEMGKHAVRALAGFRLAQRIVIGDLDEQRARAFAEACGPGFGWTGVDATEPRSLRAALEQADMVINTVGPCHPQRHKSARRLRSRRNRRRRIFGMLSTKWRQGTGGSTWVRTHSPKATERF